MARQLPNEIDEYFLLDVILVFMMINYNLPLASIYFAMVILGSIMYLVPIQFNLFSWIPSSHKNKRLQSIIIGLAMGIGFIWFYKYLNTVDPIGKVFATTAFGDSPLLSKGVFGILIPIVETRFFFRTILQWFAWKVGINVKNISPLSSGAVQLMVFFASIFTIFHATAKGVSNTIDLFATFVFAAVSIWSIFYFKQLTEATVMHITVNSSGVGIFDIVTEAYRSGALLSSPFILIIGGGIILWYLISTKKIKFPKLT